jgi:hypothetical protein
VVDELSENTNEADEEITDGENDPGEDADKPSHLLSMLSAWTRGLRLAEQTIAIAPITLARIWTRFTYAFDDIVAELRHTEIRYLGVLMHRSITAFLHAVGVEALRAAGRLPGKKAIDNPIKSSFAFFELLKALDAAKHTEDDPNLRLFWAIFSCPLWGYFLARSDIDINSKEDRGKATAAIFERYFQAVNDVAGQKHGYGVKFRRGEKMARFEGLYFLLNSVQLQGFPQPKKTVTRGGGVTLYNALEDLEKVLQPSRSKPRSRPPTPVEPPKPRPVWNRRSNPWLCAELFPWSEFPSIGSRQD